MNTRNILRQISSKDNSNHYQSELKPERERLDKFLEREEEEKLDIQKKLQDLNNEAQFLVNKLQTKEKQIC